MFFINEVSITKYPTSALIEDYDFNSDVKVKVERYQNKKGKTFAAIIATFQTGAAARILDEIELEDESDCDLWITSEGIDAPTYAVGDYLEIEGSENRFFRLGENGPKIVSGHEISTARIFNKKIHNGMTLRLYLESRGVEDLIG